MTLSIKNIVTQSAEIIAPFWPLQSFIAMNPLDGLTNLPFEQAIAQFNDYKKINAFLPLATYQHYYHQQKISNIDLESAIDQYVQKNSKACAQELKTQLLQQPITKKKNTTHTRYHTLSQQIDHLHSKNFTQEINQLLLTFLPAYFDQRQSSWMMPNHKEGIFDAWKALASRQFSIYEKHFSGILHGRTDTVLPKLLTIMKVPESDWRHVLSAHLVDLIGWASYIKWFDEHGSNRSTPHVDLLDYLTVRLSTELLVLSNSKHSKRLDYQENAKQMRSMVKENNCGATVLLTIWQDALEHAYQRTLCQSLHTAAPKKNTRPDAQAVFCIDTRSEGFRRQLENQGHYETFGFAGFFGAVFNFSERKEEVCSQQCPAFITPEITIKPKSYRKASVTSKLISLRNHLKESWLGSFSIFEAIGGWFIFKLVAKTFFPSLLPKKQPFQQQDYQILKTSDNSNGFSTEQLIDLAGSFCRSIGLTNHFSRLVLICAHHSISENNPYKSSLDCGACGGHSGIPNAVIAVFALNNAQVRLALGEQGIHIPQDSYFISGCHNTTTDEVELINTDQCPTSHKDLLNQLENDLAAASQHASKERLSYLPGDKNVQRRQSSWAELAPEFGQINNASLIIGPRFLTKSCNLQQRAFLHSYDYREDQNGDILTAILSGPLKVANWINMQYYFSTVEPNILGSGNKAIHNVVANIGVMTGNQSDLRLGLPQQCLFYRDQRLHEPLRLLVVIYAPLQHVQSAISRSPLAKKLIDNNWVKLKVISTT